MRKSRVLFAVLALLFPLAIRAETPKYNAATEATLQDTAQYVAEHPSHEKWTGVYVIMRHGPVGEIEVHLAPAGFLSDAGIEISRGDTVKVVGSIVPWHTTEILLAREVTVKGKTVVLREKDGTPRW